MKLLYLGSTDLPQTKARAIQIVHTCHALAVAGAEVTLAVGRRGRGSARDALAEYGLEPHPRLRLLRLPILRIPPTAPPRLLAQFTRAWQASYLAGLAAALPFELARRRPDVVFARDLRTARLAAGPAHAVGARLAFEVHGLPSYEVAHGAGRANLPASQVARLRALEDAVFRRADRIVTITEAARRILLDQYGVPAGRVRTVADGTTVAPRPLTPRPPLPHGPLSPQPPLAHGPLTPQPPLPHGPLTPQPPLPHGPLTPQPPLAHGPLTPQPPLPHAGEGESARGFGAGEGWCGAGEGHGAGNGGVAGGGRPAIFYVGQLYPWKGAGLVVEVAARLPEARVVIVGGQTNWTQDDPDIAALAARARALGVAERVDLRGHVPYGHVPAVLAEASVALLPLPDEPVARLFTSPLKLFDYMAAGVPIIASDLPALREVLQHERNGLLAAPGDADAFAAAVRRLLADPVLAQRLGAQASADVLRYAWSARAAALLDFLGGADREDVPAPVPEAGA